MTPHEHETSFDPMGGGNALAALGFLLALIGFIGIAETFALTHGWLSLLSCITLTTLGGLLWRAGHRLADAEDERRAVQHQLALTQEDRQ